MESSKRILIIDDEENIRLTVRIALASAGYEVEAAADGPEGLAAYGTGESWDLVILDQRMPGMDGLEVLRLLRERDPSARVLMATAYGTVELAVDAMKAGAVDFLRKPFTPDTLRRAVKTALGLARAPLSENAPDLTRLLPREPLPLQRETPLIHFRTLNGFRFWPVPLPPDEVETSSLRIRRLFEVLDEEGRRHPVAVDVTTNVRTAVAEIGRQEFPPEHAVWDLVCRGALSHFLWETAEIPDSTMAVYHLTREQQIAISKLAGQTTSRI